MNLLSARTFFFRYLFSKRANAVIRRVSFICFLGLTISIGSLLIVFNVMGGLGQAIKDRFLKTEPHLVISFKEFLDQNADTAQNADIAQNADTAYNNQQIQQKAQIEQVLKPLQEGVVGSNFFESGDVVLRSPNGLFSGARAKGYNHNPFNKLLKKQDPLLLTGDILDAPKDPFIDGFPLKKKGEAKPSQKKTNKLKNIIISWSLAEELDLYEGERVDIMPVESLLLTPSEPLNFKPARIHSIMTLQHTGGHYIFYNKEEFADLKTHSSFKPGFELSLKNPEAFKPYKELLTKAGFIVQSWADTNTSLFFALRVEKAIMTVFLSIAGLITLLSLSSLLVLLIVQKKRETGILMAMGFSPSKIKSLFLKIGLLMTLAGLLGAGGLSTFVSLFLRYVPLPFLSAFYDEKSLFPVEFHIMFMCCLFAGVLALSFVQCVLSVRSQTTLSPSALLTNRGQAH